MVYLQRYSESADGEPILENIETDEEYEIVSDAFDEMLDEEEFAEMMEDIDDEDIIEQENFKQTEFDSLATKLRLFL